jgi:hypothetical protein
MTSGLGIVGQVPQLAFSQAVDNLFPLVGANGCPNPTTDPMACYQYLNNMRTVIQQAANQQPLIRLADPNLNILTDLTGEMNASVEELMSDSGQAKVVIRYENWLEDYMINGITINQDLHLLIDPIPTYPTVDGIPQDWQIRWGGKVKELSVKNNEDGTSTIAIQAISNREHAKHLLYGASPWFPPEVQPIKMWVLPGPLRSIAFASGFVNLARLFVPGLSFVTNAFNPASWINPLNPDALLNINPMSWPIQCAFVNPVLDTSMDSVLAATWTDWHSTLADLLSNAGCIMRSYTWLTTDATSPHTELTDLINTGGDVTSSLLTSLGLATADQLIDLAEGDLGNLTRPTRNCVVLAFEDMSGITGPIGGATTGLLELIGVTADDMITSVLFDQQTGQTINGEEVIDVDAVTPLVQSLEGIELQNPQVIWRDGQFTGLVHREVNMHKGPPLTMMLGGRSPSIVNQLQTFGIRYALSELSAEINLGIGMAATFNPVDMSVQVPATPGLDNIYQGQLDNTFLAWERYTDPLRALWTGELAFQEYIERGTSSAYTLAAWLGLAESDWKTRAFYGFQTKALNGRPWVYGVDFQLGQRIGFEMDAIIFVDQLTAVKWTYDRKQSKFLELSIGDDKDKHDPVAQTLRIISGIYSLVGSYLGEGTLFG